jgi:hypothetical protein
MTVDWSLRLKRGRGRKKKKKARSKRRRKRKNKLGRQIQPAVLLVYVQGLIRKTTLLAKLEK